MARNKQAKGEKQHMVVDAQAKEHRVWWGYYTVGVWFALEIARDVGLW